MFIVKAKKVKFYRKNFYHLFVRLVLIPKEMRSQCYDRGGNMSGKMKGVDPQIQRQYPKAIPFWCVAHQLNWCIVKACRFQLGSNVMHTVDQVVRFFEYSPAKQEKLEKIIGICEEIDSQKQKFKELCKTRCVVCGTSWWSRQTD